MLNAKKWRAIALYVAYAIALTLVILYGTSVSSAITDYLLEYTHNNTITDVEVELAPSYVVGQTYQPTYTPKGNFGSNAELKFEALDDTVKVVDKNTGSFKGVRTDADKTSGRIRISSSFDPEFEKIITVSFEKKYPEKVRVQYVAISQGYNTETLTVGLKFKAYLEAAPGQIYSELDYTLDFDTEYIKENSDGTFTPIKATPDGKTCCVSFVMGNGLTAKTSNFSIVDNAVSDFDGVELRQIGDMSLPYGAVGSSYFIYPTKNGERVAASYNFSSENGLFSSNGRYGIKFKKIGDDTLTISRSDGFEIKIPISIRNVITTPEIKGEAVKNDTITVRLHQPITLPISFSGGATYTQINLTSDSSVLSADATNSSITIEGVNVGESFITLTVDDGYQRVEKTYKVKVLMHETVEDMVRYDTRVFVFKILGHFCGFGIFAFFGMYAFRYVEIKNKLLRFFLYSIGGVSVAVFTEYAQSFMPGRTSTVEDVLLDIGSYYLSTLLVLALYFFIYIINSFKLRGELKRRRMQIRALAKTKSGSAS